MDTRAEEPMEAPSREATFPRVTRREVAILAGLVVLGFLLRVWWVGASPLHPDEHYYAYRMMAAEETASLGSVRDLSTRFVEERRVSHPLTWSLMSRWLWFLPVGWAMDWSSGFLRIPNVMMGTLLIAAGWAIMRVAAAREQALASALFIALCPGLVWISRTMYYDPPYTMWIALMILGGAFSLKLPSRWPSVLVGCGLGLALATKLSGPILVPAGMLLALSGPRGLAMRRRGERLLIAGGLALGIFLLFCDPMAYAETIRAPTDPRYDGAVSLTQVERTLIADLDVFLNILSLDLPATIFLCLLAAALGWRERRAVFPLLLLGTLACLSPLVLLHMPPLSGPHGFAPIYFVLMLLAAPVVDLRPRWAMIGLLSASAGLALALIIARETGGLDRVARAGVYPPRDPLYTALRGDLHRRDLPRQILIGDGYLFFHRAWGVIRLAELTEGAVLMMSADESGIPDAAWDLADVVVLPHDASTYPDAALFRRTFANEEFEVWRRVQGETRRDFSVGELEELGNGEYLLPGGMRIVGGRVAVNGAVLPRTHQEEAPVSMDGRVSFMDWGSGRLFVREDAGEVRLRLESPLMEDVFWQY